MSRPLEKRMRPISVIAVLATLGMFLMLAPHSAQAAAGQTGFAFLKLGVGARAMGMGSAYVALADDPTATYWNPAGLAAVRSTQVTAMHNEWLQDFRQEYAAVGAPLGKGTLGFSLAGFYSSEQLEGRDETGVFTHNFGFNDLSIAAAYGRPLAPGLDAGLAVRYLREMIDDQDAKALAADVGARYRVGSSGFSLGAVAQNIGGKPKFDQGSSTVPMTPIDLPLTLRAGAALTRPLASLHSVGTLSTEIHKSRAEDARFNLGGELVYKERLALRAGGKFGYDAEKISFGIGLTQSKLRFDYALVPLSSDLGTTHFFSLTAKL